MQLTDFRTVVFSLRLAFFKLHISLHLLEEKAPPPHRNPT